MKEQAKFASSEPVGRHRLAECSWGEINEPGAYVELGTGDLYRVPKEALLEGSSPYIRKESAGGSNLMKVTADPFVTTLEARMICAEHNIKPNF
ncbi:MAG: hypothetical protein MI754_01105 [Chromatiales bacterium]|nr:hypothetical protein [Chromatiales bacterium]